MNRAPHRADRAPRRRLALLALLATLATLAAACGDDDTADDDGQEEGASTDEETDDGASGEQAAFPVTIGHKYGETVIEEAPERVVSVGYTDQDDLLALGVVPVGIRDWYGDQPDAVWPWARDALGDAEPEEVLSAAEINFEQVAALEPDLIVGVSSGMTEEEYETLSQIAPTLTQTDDYVDYGTPWSEQTRLIGQAVGRADEAEELVTTLEDRFVEISAEHPEFDGATAAVAFFFEDQPGAYASSDARSRVMTDLGFTIPEEYDELAGDAFFTSISEEEIELLDVDALVWLGSTRADLRPAVDSPLRTSLAAVAEGREVFVTDELGGALSFASPLSLDYLLDELVPELEAAVDGDPATEVPSAAAVAGGGSEAEDTGDGDEAGAEPDEEATAAMEAWAVVFDSGTDFVDKAPHLEDADALESSNSAYADAGDGMGGISLQPSAAEVDGTRATVTYDVLFGGNPAYEDLTGTITLVDDVWMVSRDEYCDFLQSARTPCDG